METNRKISHLNGIAYSKPLSWRVSIRHCGVICESIYLCNWLGCCAVPVAAGACRKDSAPALASISPWVQRNSPFRWRATFPPPSRRTYRPAGAGNGAPAGSASRVAFCGGRWGRWPASPATPPPPSWWIRPGSGTGRRCGTPRMHPRPLWKSQTDKITHCHSIILLIFVDIDVVNSQ